MYKIWDIQLLLIFNVFSNTFKFEYHVFLGILISGGHGADADTILSVEVFSPTHQCVLPSLPDGRWGHTSDGLTLCGAGWKTNKATCTTFSSGKWVTSHALAEERRYHTSWNNMEEGKIILMGGQSSGNTTETLTFGEYDGVPGFPMKYDTQ